jgi:amidohydrolase
MTTDSLSGKAQANAGTLDEIDELKREACEWIDSRRSELIEISRKIHARPELSFEEYAASALLIEVLGAAGLEVESGSYGLDTAFEAEFGAGEGPRVALLAEYDALPEIGHACGHNLIATASVGASLALLNQTRSLPGRVRILGTPAEEDGGGKELMLRKGAFEGVDCALMMHPAGFNLAAMPCISKAEVEVVYRGRASHAAAAPERGINALDALVVAYQSVGALRQHIAPDERIHGIFVDGGQAPNIVPERAAGRFFVRSPFRPGLEDLKKRVEGCFEAGAAATGAELEVTWGDVDYLDLRSNIPLQETFQSNAEFLGRRFIPQGMIPGAMAGSTDMGNVSHHVPSIHPMLAAAPPRVNIHNREFADHAGSELGDEAAIDGAKILAMTAIEFLYDPDLRERTRNAFEHGETT